MGKMLSYFYKTGSPHKKVQRKWLSQQFDVTNKFGVTLETGIL
jgi:hypothetical protein